MRESRGIPVVSPVPLVNNSALEKNPTPFYGQLFTEVVQKALGQKK